MKYSFPVVVFDDAKKPVTGARVCLVRASALAGMEHPYPKVAATHKDAGEGKYDDGKSIAMGEGDWVLIVALKGKSPAVQPIKVTTGGDGKLVFRQSPKPAATVSMPPLKRKVSKEGLYEIPSIVTLWPAAELVFISGLDYNRKEVSEGWMFHLYAFDRAEVLRREKQIDVGTVVTVFSTPKIWRKKRVYGPRGWFDIETLQLGDPSTRTLVDPPDKYHPKDKLDIHIDAFYGYLADVGKREPKSVKEFGIFSHSWPGGPILYDSYQVTLDPVTGRIIKDYRKLPERCPADFDARPKDFNSTNFPKHKSMIDSFAPGCRFWIWGCSATALFNDRAVAAMAAIKKGLPEDGFFTVTTHIYNDHVKPRKLLTTIIENTSELRHRYEMDQQFRSGPYAAAAAKTLGIEVRAGTPGTGSDPKTVDGLIVMKVNLVDYGRLFEYYHRKFGPEFQETRGQWESGFVDYHAMQGRAPVAKPPFGWKFYHFEIEYNVDTAQGEVPYWTLRFDRPTRPLFRKRSQVTVKTQEKRGVVTAGVNGQLVIVVDKVPKESRGFYVQEDGKIFLMAQDSFKQWMLPFQEI